MADTSEGQKSRLGKVQKLDGGLSFVEDAQQNALTVPLRGKLETLAALNKPINLIK